MKIQEPLNSKYSPRERRQLQTGTTHLLKRGPPTRGEDTEGVGWPLLHERLTDLVGYDVRSPFTPVPSLSGVHGMT